MGRIAAMKCVVWDRLLLWDVTLGTDCYYEVRCMGRIVGMKCVVWDGLPSSDVIPGSDCCNEVYHLGLLCGMSEVWEGLLQ